MYEFYYVSYDESILLNLLCAIPQFFHFNFFPSLIKLRKQQKKRTTLTKK